LIQDYEPNSLLANFRAVRASYEGEILITLLDWRPRRLGVLASKPGNGGLSVFGWQLFFMFHR
jgi:hypothetical protein